MIPVTDIENAAARIGGRVHRTPILSSLELGRRVGGVALLKCENLQKTGSFKPRGALNRVLTLPSGDRARGLITVSAGNHAQAVAWAARQIGAPCTVVMPTGAPKSKIDAVTGYGAEIVLHPERATLFERLEREREARGATFIHPFDDGLVLAGAGTTGLEIVEDVSEVGIVVVPVGGGGLLGGVTSAVKQLRPDCRVVAVELEAGPGLGPALEAGRPVTVERPSNTVADGMTPPFVGALPLEIAREAVDAVVTVGEQEIIDAMRFLMTRCKLYVEGSGAAATAALLSGKISVGARTTVVSIVSGGNIDIGTMCSAIA